MLFDCAPLSAIVPAFFSGGERGNTRGVTGWYHLYVKPLKGEAKTAKIARYGILVLLLEAVVIAVVRMKNTA